jgi:hypothetical protein
MQRRTFRRFCDPGERRGRKFEGRVARGIPLHDTYSLRFFDGKPELLDYAAKSSRHDPDFEVGNHESLEPAHLATSGAAERLGIAVEGGMGASVQPPPVEHEERRLAEYASGCA